MIKPMLTHLLAHVVSQNTWAKPMLLPFATKAVRFNMPPVSANLIVLEDGGLAMAGETAQAEAVVQISFSTVLRLLANDETATNGIHIEGNTELAATIAKVLRNMSWQVEEDLSKVMGDVAAHQTVQFGRNTLEGAKKQSINLAQMAAEYWQEEQPLIAKKRHVDNFLTEVDLLREDIERFEKRLEKLAEKLSNSLNPSSNEPLKENPQP